MVLFFFFFLFFRVVIALCLYQFVFIIDKNIDRQEKYYRLLQRNQFIFIIDKDIDRQEKFYCLLLGILYLKTFFSLLLFSGYHSQTTVPGNISKLVVCSSLTGFQGSGYLSRTSGYCFSKAEMPRNSVSARLQRFSSSILLANIS